LRDSSKIMKETTIAHLRDSSKIMKEATIPHLRNCVLLWLLSWF
jgi:hypothetical protein